MSTCRLAALIFLLTACSRASDLKDPGSLSDKLALAVFYEPAEPKFSVVLTNQTNSPLELRVEARQFHGSIVVTTAANEAVEYFDSAFIPMLLTSTWGVPIQTLAAHANITWTLPLSQLQDIHRNYFAASKLQGAKVHAKLGEVAVIPRDRNYIANNARQVSPPITVPDR